MIPAEKGYLAIYGRTDDNGRLVQINDERDVIAWDDDGEPLVLGDARLVRADWYPNFRQIRQDDREIVSMIPAGQFSIVYVSDDGHSFTTPLVGWGLTSGGSIVPLDTDAAGFVSEPRDTTGKFRITHPGEF